MHDQLHNSSAAAAGEAGTLTVQAATCITDVPVILIASRLAMDLAPGHPGDAASAGSGGANGGGAGAQSRRAAAAAMGAEIALSDEEEDVGGDIIMAEPQLGDDEDAGGVPMALVDGYVLAAFLLLLGSPQFFWYQSVKPNMYGGCEFKSQ